MWTMTFWRDAAERALKTGAQAAAVLLGGGVGLLDVDWVPALSGVGALVLASLLTSVASTVVGDPSSAALSTGRHAA